jgi:muramoyltetrapeptide carboxypeptidase
LTLKGHVLRPGGTIGVPAPAQGYHNRSEVLRGVEWWEGKGYNVKLGCNIYARDGYVAGSPEGRAQDIMDMFTDDEVDVVHCLQGGYGSAQTIDLLNFDAIRANPKPFIGYSDITALHTALRHYTELVTFYGPGLAGVNDRETRPFTQERLLKALTSAGPLGEVPRDPEDDYIRALGGGSVTAPMVGGCLWLLGQAIGTPWQPDFADKVLFFEDYDAPPFYVDGILNQMRQAGLLDEVVGVVVGEMEKCDWSEDRPEFPQTLSIEDVLERYIEPLGVPALYGYPLGHGERLCTIPLGVSTVLNGDDRTLTIQEPALLE